MHAFCTKFKLIFNIRYLLWIQ